MQQLCERCQPSALGSRSGAIEDVEDVGTGSVADHGACAGWIADVAREEIAGYSDVHFRNDVAIGGGFIGDAIEDGCCVLRAIEAAQCFCERDVDEEELLALVPILEDGGIGVGAAHTAIAAGSNAEQFHALDGIADEGLVRDEAEVEDGQKSAVDVVLDAVFECAVQVAVADEGGVESFLEQSNFFD